MLLRCMVNEMISTVVKGDGMVRGMHQLLLLVLMITGPTAVQQYTPGAGTVGWLVVVADTLPDDTVLSESLQQ